MSSQAAHAAPGLSVAPVSIWGRIYGFGSLYAKTLRDSRLAILVIGGVLGGLMLATGSQYAQGYKTVKSRVDFANLVGQLPAVMAGVYGDPRPAHLTTLGGMVSLKVAASVAIIAGFWSIVALSSTLASEARRGSLELVAVGPLGLRRVAIEKLAGHLTAMALVMAVVALTSVLAGRLGTLPGDAISPAAAGGFAVWVGLIALASGSIAFALAPVVGRAGAAGIAGAILMGGYLLNGYRAAVPAFSGVANATWFGWTTQHQPLAAQFDWPSLVPVALVALLFFVIGVEVFARRDLGRTTAIPWLRFPAFTLGLGGPARRSLGDRLPLALAWGAGIGIFGMGLGASAGSLNATLAKTSPDSLKIFHTLFPKIDITTAGGFLQLAFVELGFIVIGFAAMTLVTGWASDESRGRLELLLAAPLARARWALASGLGVMSAIAVMTAVAALGIGAGAALVGSDATTPMLGTLVLGLYGAGLAGVGLALGGIFRPSIAGGAVALLVTATFLIDLLAPALRLPDWVDKLALTTHLGQPMIGSWDWTGIVACLVLASGGLALCAWGMRRRDLVPGD
jgi:ABC-2 type transport system permease protein